MQARPIPSCSVCQSVRLSPSRSCILSKRINILSIFFHNCIAISHTILFFPHQMSWQYSDGEPLTAASNTAGEGTNHDSGRIAGYRAMMTAAVCDQQLTVIGGVAYRSYGARLFTAQRPPRISEYAGEKRREHNLSVRSGKSEAEVTDNRRLRSTYCIIEGILLTGIKHRAGFDLSHLPAV